MRILFLIILSLMLNGYSWAYLTAGKIAVTATSSSSGVPSTSQDSDITDTKGSSVAVGVPVAVTGNVNITGNYQVNGTPISATSNWNQSGSTINYTAGNVGVGSSNPGQALDVQGTIRSNLGYVGPGLNYLQTQTPSGASSFTFSGLNSTARYMVVFNFTQNTTSGYLKVTFNGDSGSHYNWMQFGNNGGSADSAGATGTAFIEIMHNTVLFSTQATLQFQFSQIPSTQVVNLIGSDFYMIPGPADNAEVCSGDWSNSANLTSITFTPSAGTVTGTAVLYQLN